MIQIHDNSDLISVVIPIYNVEKYLEKCIVSVLNQTYKNIEIILVNDGSTDNCSNICDKYAKKDKRIRVVHKTNGGLSDARNAGINIAKGKYISFIDSDDYVDFEYIEYLHDLNKKFNTKISCCGHNICFDRKIVHKVAETESSVDKISALKYILYDREIDICSWGKLYDKLLFENIRFPKGRIFEDTATTYLLFDKCDNIAVGNKCKYNYVIRDDSITSRNFNLKKMDLIEMTKIMCLFLNGKYPELESACNRRLMWAYMSTYVKIIFTKKGDFVNEKTHIKNYINENKDNILKDKNISTRDRISLKLFKYGDFVFKYIWMIYKKIYK